MVEALDQTVKSKNINAEVELYAGVHHGFAFPQRGAVYDKPAAERHWERLFALVEAVGRARRNPGGAGIAKRERRPQSCFTWEMR